MCYRVYILYSEKLDVYYRGQTKDLSDRLYRHNAGQEKATRRGVPWKLVWSTHVNSRSESLILERKLKNLSRERLKMFIGKYNVGVVGHDDAVQ